MKESNWTLIDTAASIFKNFFIFPKGPWDFEDTGSVELKLFNAFTDVLQCPKIDKMNE